MTERARRLLDVALALDPLAELPRTGWLLRGVRPCESIADHSYGVSVLTMLLIDALRAEGETIDGEKALRIALLHDASEARTGDIPMPVKTPALDRALAETERTLVQQMLPASLVSLWDELEEGQTIEARIVRAADKLHMMLKAFAYERSGRGHLDEFWMNPKTFHDRGIPLVKELFDELKERAGKTQIDSVF